MDHNIFFFKGLEVGPLERWRWRHYVPLNAWVLSYSLRRRLCQKASQQHSHENYKNCFSDHL